MLDGNARTGAWDDIEDLMGRRVLGWAGGAAVLVGLVCLLVMAASRGWIGEEARVLMAAAGSLVLIAGGAWARERRGVRDVALAAAASGCAGLFATLVVAGPGYGLVPALAALAGALGAGAATTALALRWRSQGMGWLGLLGSVGAPLLVGAHGDAAIALMLAAYVATAAVGLWQRWHAIAGAAFLLAAFQLVSWAAPLGWGDGPATAGVLAALAVFGLATAVAAVGFEWRSRAPRPRRSAVVLLAANALVLAFLGAAAAPSPAVWLGALALAHLAGGLAARRARGVSRELAVAGLALGVVLGDVALAQAVGELPLVAGWAAGAVGFAALTRIARHRADEVAALAGLGGHLLLALATALAGSGADPQGTLLTMLAVSAASAWAAARLLPARHAPLAVALDGLAVVLLVLWSAVAFEGAALTVALAVEAVALAAVAARHLSLAVLGLAFAHTLAVLAPPEVLATGFTAAGPATAALGAVLAAAVAVARRGPAQLRAPLLAGAGLTGLYLASALVLTPFAPAEQGQPLMSALWALTGVALLVAGLVRDTRALRLGGLALLGAAAAKVFLADLTSLDALYRVGSFLALGVLLMLGGYAWQRLRPEPLADAPHQYP